MEARPAWMHTEQGSNADNGDATNIGHLNGHNT